MIEDLEDSALQELKRADHLIYVTLKYTRTVDVIKNTIKRLKIKITKRLRKIKERKGSRVDKNV